MTETGFLDLCDLARAAVQRGDMDSARRRFEEALRLKPDDFDTRYGLATVCFMMRDPHAARGHFFELQQQNPYHAGAAINLGAIANMLGEYDEAVRQLRKGIGLDPKRGEAYYNLGIAYRKLGRSELAIQAYREAAHHNPRMVEALYNLANVYFEMERYDQAATFYRKAIDVNPGFKKATDGLVRAEQKLRPDPQEFAALDDDSSADLDPFSGDVRLDRMLTPDGDFDMLARFHQETADAKKQSEAMIQLIEKLNESVRDLAIGISTHGGGPDLTDVIERFRAMSGHFQNALSHMDEKRKGIEKLRDHMIDRG